MVGLGRVVDLVSGGGVVGLVGEEWHRVASKSRHGGSAGRAASLREGSLRFRCRP